jgi:cell wall-associated NlpC family hydrolase
LAVSSTNTDAAPHDRLKTPFTGAESDLHHLAAQPFTDSGPHLAGRLATHDEILEAGRSKQAVAVSVQRTTPQADTNWAGPAASGGAGAAVAFAEAQVGKPYQFAATGPATYDCSGLTMRAWQAGVSMAHFSGAQYSAFPKVPMDRLQPGDLVFPSDPGAHVGIYIGGGMMIHATHTGDFVRRDPISQSGLVMAQAVRPG